LFCGTPSTWQQASASCTQSGGTLAVITSSVENQALHAEIASRLGVTAWIGARDTIVEDVWVWSDGRLLDDLRYWRSFLNP
jgi:hypothetical protein